MRSLLERGELTARQIDAWISNDEDEHLEFKEAKERFDFELLVKYCAAIANEGGGRIILGVTDRRPRSVVGTRAFSEVKRTKAGLIERLRLFIEAEEVQHHAGRVVVFEIPPRPIGMPIQYGGAYWMRAGDNLVPMTPDRLKRIFDEAGPDFSADVCEGAAPSDLRPDCIDWFRDSWARKSGSKSIRELSDEQVLTDAELLLDGSVTFAALILMGSRQALGRHLAQAEVVFEYRSNDVTGAYQQRDEFREGLFSFLNVLWTKINLRNEVQHHQDGLFVWDIPTFGERTVREAVLNAVSHRDYRLTGSVFVRQFPRRLEIVSPGGFPPGITPDNILWRQSPRNRRLAEALARCGLVERSGQGMNEIFEQSIRQSKPVPDFVGSDAYQVSLTLLGEVQEPGFLRFLERLGRNRLQSFDTRDFLALDRVHRDHPVPDALKSNLAKLIDLGVVEHMSRGRYVLARSLYEVMGQPGVYTRKRSLDHETNKALLISHLEGCSAVGAQMGELLQVLPALTRPQVKRLLQELRREGRVRSDGRTRAARWFVGDVAQDAAVAGVAVRCDSPDLDSNPAHDPMRSNL